MKPIHSSELFELNEEEATEVAGGRTECRTEVINITLPCFTPHPSAAPICPPPPPPQIITYCYEIPDPPPPPSGR